MSGAELFRTVPKELNLPFIYDGEQVNIKQLMEFLHLDRSDIAVICGVKPELVRFDDRMSMEVRSTLLEIANLCEHVAQYFDGDRTKTETWFAVPNPSLDNKSPREFIIEGRHRKITELINQNIGPVSDK